MMEILCEAGELLDEECDLVANTLVLTLRESGNYEVLASCAVHAPEIVHEVRSSMADNEYAIVTIGPNNP